MTAFDEPSCDGEWNIKNKSSTWWSPIELYDKENLCGTIPGTGYDFMYTNTLGHIIRHERRWDFSMDISSGRNNIIR